MNLIQANRIRANPSQASLNRVNRIRRVEVSRTQAMPATVIPTAPATRPQPLFGVRKPSEEIRFGFDGRNRS